MNDHMDFSGKPLRLAIAPELVIAPFSWSHYISEVPDFAMGTGMLREKKDLIKISGHSWNAADLQT